MKNPFNKISLGDFKDKDNGYGNVLSEIEETCRKPWNLIVSKSWVTRYWPVKIQNPRGRGITFTHKVSNDDHLESKKVVSTVFEFS